MICLAILAGLSISLRSVAGEAPHKKTKGKATAVAPRKKGTGTAAITPTPAGIIKYLEKWDFIRVKNLNQLSAEITKANKLAPVVIKSFDTRNPGKTSLSDVEKVVQYGEYLSSYIGNMDYYNQTTMSMAEGIMLKLKYYEFATYYIYGKMAEEMSTDQTRSACYNAILGEEAFYKYSSDLIANIGSLGSYGGSFMLCDYPARLINCRQAWVTMLVTQYEMLKGSYIAVGKPDPQAVWDKMERKAIREISESEEWVPVDALADMGLSDIRGSFREGAEKGEAAMKACYTWLDLIGKSANETATLKANTEMAADIMLRAWLKSMDSD